MKKSLIVLLALVAVLSLAGMAFARDAFTVKLGVNASGLEYERISDNGKSFFITETNYYRHFDNDFHGRYMAYSFLTGIRKHDSVDGNHKYFGLAAGFSDWEPLVNAHAGYEFHINPLPEFMYLRGEGGLSLVVNWNLRVEPIVHFGGGIGINFDMNWFKF